MVCTTDHPLNGEVVWFPTVAGESVAAPRTQPAGQEVEVSVVAIVVGMGEVVPAEPDWFVCWFSDRPGRSTFFAWSCHALHYGHDVTFRGRSGEAWHPEES